MRSTLNPQSRRSPSAGCEVQAPSEVQVSRDPATVIANAVGRCLQWYLPDLLRDGPCVLPSGLSHAKTFPSETQQPQGECS